MRLSCICVGALRNKAYRAAADDYVKRLKHYVPFVERELKAVRGKRSDVEIRDAESKRILDTLPKNATIVVLDERGVGLDSPAFAKFVGSHMNSGRDLAFVIGGALGHGDALRARADRLLAISPWTLPHELARVLLVEQLYRAMTIVRGESYHK